MIRTTNNKWSFIFAFNYFFYIFLILLHSYKVFLSFFLHTLLRAKNHEAIVKRVDHKISRINLGEPKIVGECHAGHEGGGQLREIGGPR